MRNLLDLYCVNFKTDFKCEDDKCDALALLWAMVRLKCESS